LKRACILKDKVNVTESLKVANRREDRQCSETKQTLILDCKI